MINILKKFFENQNNTEKDSDNNSLKLLCGLMVEAANTDGLVDEKEIKKINSILIDIFEENPADVENVLEEALEEKNNSKSLFYYTSKINKEYSKEKKILLIETLWEIILSDDKVHDYESNLLRRLAGLLYISDVDSGNARKRALNK